MKLPLGFRFSSVYCGLRRVENNQRRDDLALIVSGAPGLGVQVDEAVIDRYPWIPGPWSLFRTDSPPETRAVTADHSLKWEPPA